MSKIFKTKCMVSTDLGMDTAIYSCTIAVDGDKVTFSGTYNSDKSYSVPLEFIKNIVKDYHLNGFTKMHIDENNSIAVRYTKGGFFVNDEQTTISISDYPENFMISADCTKFDKWIRSQIRKEMKS